MSWAVSYPPVGFAGRALRWLWGKNKPITIAVVGVVGVIKIRSYMRKKELRKKWNAAGKDVVVLHMFNRGKVCPSLSPFVVKLETYLKMADIPYQVDYEEPMGPKGKSPWITLNGEDMTDSHFIMQRLGVKFNKNLSSDLSAEDKAVALSMQRMVDEHFLWVLCVWRYNLMKGKPILEYMKLPFVVRFLIPTMVKKIVAATKAQGTGRHSYHEVEQLGREDLEALSNYLGEKLYLMGDKPTEVDCAVFGMLSQVLWHSPNSPYLRMLEVDYRNLYTYCHRIKETFWQDWDKCIDP